MLRVGIDGRPLAERPCGFRRYLEGLLPALGRVDPGLEVVLFTTTTAPEPRGLPVNLPVNRSAGSLFTLFRPWWEIRSLPRALTGADVDVFFSSCGALPLAPPTPAVAMIHDLAPLRVPGTQPWYYSWYWRTVYRRCRRADRVVVPSLATRHDVIELLGLDPRRVSVVPNAADKRFRPAPAPAIARVLAARGVHGKYVLAVGTREPRKNLATLVAAMTGVNRERSEPVKLVVAGSRGWGSQASLRRCPEWVRVLGPVPDDDLVALYSGAAVFAFPSLYEGFGLPVLEAMCCGAPVVASETSAIPELAGDAAILVGPTDTAGWTGAIQGLLHDAARRRELAQRVRRRAQSYSWDATARGVAAAVRASAEGPYAADADAGDHRARPGRATSAAGIPARCDSVSVR